MRVALLILIVPNNRLTLNAYYPNLTRNPMQNRRFSIVIHGDY